MLKSVEAKDFKESFRGGTYSPHMMAPDPSIIVGKGESVGDGTEGFDERDGEVEIVP
jgi:hypothetical protein